MKPTCKKRIYLTKQSGPRTKYVTPGSMLREITEQTPLKREAEINGINNHKNRHRNNKNCRKIRYLQQPLKHKSLYA